MAVQWRDERSGRATRLPLLAGGSTWIPVRWGVMTTWDTTWLGLGYVGWNRLMLVPLTLLVAGCVGSARTAHGRPLTVGWWVLAVGFVLAWAGVFLEFVVGGGLRGGPPVLAMAGWGAYLLGTSLAGLGAAVVAVASVRDRSRPRRPGAIAALGLAAASMLAWPVIMMTGASGAGLVDQVVVGAAWVLVGLTVPRTSATDEHRHGLPTGRSPA